MRTFIAIIFGVGIATAVAYYQNPDVVMDAPRDLAALVSSQAPKMEKVPDSFGSLTATSTPRPSARTPTRPPSRQNSDANAAEDATDRIMELEQMVHAGINAARSRHGISPQLRWEDQLGAVARAHSDDMTRRGYFSHDSPEGLGPSERIDRAGYSCWKGSHYGVAENIAIQPASSSIERIADGAVLGWLNSPGHRTNLLGRQYDRTGIGASFGVWRGQRSVYLTQVFC